MNITAIQTFLSVVRTGNLNRAAEEMHITQSAVSARLDALDQALGARLLVRSRKGAQLTKAGYAFLEQAELISRSWEAAQTRITLPEGVTRLFSLACDPGLWTGLGAGWCAQIVRDYPETGFDIWSGYATNAQRWLQSGMSDAALLTEPLQGAHLDNRVLCTEALILVATRPRPLMEWDPDYIYVDYGPALRAKHAEAWPRSETTSFSFSNPDWALAHLMSAGGSAYLPRLMAQDGLSNGTLHEVQGAPVFERRVYLSWRKAQETAFPWLSDHTPYDPATPPPAG